MIKTAMIGLGAIGERLLDKFRSHEEIQLAAICEQNEEKVAAFSGRLPEVSFYTDYKEMLNEPFDLVYIGVPPKFHHDIALYAMEKGIHVICEKPLANSLEEAEEMAAAAKKAGVVNAINFPLMYSKAVYTMKEKTANGEIGALKRVELKIHHAKWPRPWQENAWIGGREQGGFIREISPHYIQLIHDVLGELKNVEANVQYPEDEALCETGVIASMELADGTPVLVDGLSGIGQEDHVLFKLYGEEGTLSFINWGTLEQGTAVSSSEEITLSPDAPSVDLISETVKAIKGQDSKIVTFEEGLRVQGILEQLLGKVTKVHN
ncbi:Gfo/Idh/MocA family protein [Falsibacillus pallidus]|uniref:Gfo/Idh/MocA family protein n=1 Tax=Falsibacillus pallidus TaxID=493781 RepID=UPI003D978F7E